MTVLDASVVIAHLSAADAHHSEATALLLATTGTIRMSTITVAEVLAGYAAGDRMADGIADLEAIGVEEWPLPPDAAVRLAQLRVSSGLKMPDCCVLLAAEDAGSPVASFDDRLREAASRRGLTVVPTP